jgi:hypothetical protein
VKIYAKTAESGEYAPSGHSCGKEFNPIPFVDEESHRQRAEPGDQVHGYTLQASDLQICQSESPFDRRH